MCLIINFSYWPQNNYSTQLNAIFFLITWINYCVHSTLLFIVVCFTLPIVCSQTWLSAFWRYFSLEAFHFLWWKWVVWSDFILFSDKWYNRKWPSHSGDHRSFLLFKKKKTSRNAKIKSNENKFLKIQASPKHSFYFIKFCWPLSLEFGHIHFFLFN